jgi:hypothetical protein
VTFDTRRYRGLNRLGDLPVLQVNEGHCRIAEPEGATVISALNWILIVAGGWVCLAAVVGLVVGRIIRNRDRQVPSDPENRPGNVEQKAPPASPQRSRREP